MMTRILFFALLSALSAGAHTATLYVEKWGRITSGCGARNDPCGSINATLLEPGFTTNARILVGPGIYPEWVAFTMDGVRLESLAGARVTMLRTPEDFHHVIHAEGDRVRVGRRGKGFTVAGASADLVSGIRVDGDRVRVEGNITYGNYFGIRITGERPQVRYNEIRNNVYYGLECRHCYRGIIEQNRVVDNLVGIGVAGNAARFQVRRNVVRSNTLTGIEISNNPLHQRYTVKDNVAEHNSGGIFAGNADGAMFQGNLLGINSGEGMQLRQNTFERPARVRNNIAMGGPSETSNGFYLEIVGNLEFQGNSAVQNGGSGLSIGALSTLGSLRGNNFYANGAVAPSNDCSISNSSIISPTVVQAFLGSPAGTPAGPDAQTNDNDGHDTICGPNPYDFPGNAWTSRPRPYRASAAARL
jgi:parallel beta-helix repeat protein